MEDKYYGSAFDPYQGEWKLSWPERLGEHDIVYLAPPDDPLHGFPLGDGQSGALVHTDGGRLIVNLNKCDLWDINPKRTPEHWEEIGEGDTCLRHAGRLEIDFHQPVFDVLYQHDFTGRLSMADATLALRARTEFSTVGVSAFYAREPSVLCVDVERSGDEPAEADVILSRWGSRAFSRWYSHVTRDASVGLGGTASRIEGDVFLISQSLRTMRFAVAAAVTGAKPKKRQTREGVFHLDGQSACRYTVYVAIVSSNDSQDPEGEALRRVRSAMARGRDALHAAHADAWRSFWDGTFIDIPDKYIENLWYSNLYLANSSSHGEYPPHFTSGIWGFMGDFVPWKDIFHWNTQWTVKSLITSGRPRLADPYMKYRRRQLPLCRIYAAKFHGKPGALYADVCDGAGYGASDVKDNLSPGAQIALDMWTYYRYTGDLEFLRETAWPVMEAVAAFYESVFETDSDGIRHVPASSAYEGSPLFQDSVVDLASAKALFGVMPVASEALGLDAERWRGIAQGIADYTLIPLEESEIVERGGRQYLSGGLGADRPLESPCVYAVGREIRDDQDRGGSQAGTIVRNRYADGRASYYGIPDPELVAVYPSGTVGLSKRGQPQFEAAVNQAGMHPQPKDAPSIKDAMSDAYESCMGWCPYPIVLARLGLGEKAYDALRASASHWQWFPQGFGHYGPYGIFHRENNLRFFTYRPQERLSGERVLTDNWPFRHFDNESVPILCTALNEMLLQSYEGKLRIAPAVPLSWSFRYRLMAEGGFRVDCAVKDGLLEWLCVERVHPGDERIHIVNPWPEIESACLTEIKDGAASEVTRVSPVTDGDGESVYAVAIGSGARYLLSPKNLTGIWRAETTVFPVNNAPKALGNARLGKERRF